MKRLHDLMYVLTAVFQFLLFLFQKDSKFGRDVSLSVVWFGRWASFLVGLVGSYLVEVVFMCPGYVIWGGSTVLMG